VGPRFLGLISALFSVLGCADPQRLIKTSAGNLNQPQVDAITVGCGGPRGMAKIKDAKLVIYPAKDLAITGCVLSTLQATGETSLNAVENERHDPPNAQ
jgi:hypothetical protein